MGKFVHSCEGEMVCESVNVKIPYFNAPIYLENKVHRIENRIRSSRKLTRGSNKSAKLTRSSGRSTKSISPSNLRRESSRLRSKPETSFLSEEISSYRSTSMATPSKPEMESLTAI
jgi:rRNA processing protein Gar1